MAAFHVPTDLADKDMTLAEVRAILEIRRKRKIVQNRLDNLPKKGEELKAEISKLTEEEAALLAREAETEAP